jgi:hypothetical protein
MKFVWPAVFYNGLAVVTFSSVYYRHVNEETGRISDVVSSLDVALYGHPGLSNREREGLRDGVKLYEALVCYQPKYRKMWLRRYKIEGPAVGQKAADSRVSLERALSLSPI